MRRCHHCGAEWISEKKQPAVKDICPECSAYLHCCLNCRFHELGSHNECNIPNTDWVGDRTGLNFCDEFEFTISETTVAGSQNSQESRDAFDRLFGASEHKKDSERLKDFEKLFGE